ncbi:MAG: adenylyltransferase/cytidyltransferase family protein, partial [Fimbriimonadaceae bacterium]
MRVAIYPGSFDPPTFGHLDIVERAARLFDRLIIAVGRNRGKSGFLSVDERMDALLKS